MTANILPPLTGDVARFGGWFVRVGDSVSEGERLAELLIPGAAIDVLSPGDGVLATRGVRRNDEVNAGTVLGTLEIVE